jgi:hypothetical protein
MLDAIETELPLDTAAKRALIESELRKDAGRSDREIARIVGCDHKTVGAARDRLGIASPLGNFTPPTPTEHRQMLINAGEAFDAKYPPGPSEVRAAEEAVDNAIAEGKIGYANAGRGGVGDEVAARPCVNVREIVSKLAPEDDPNMQMYWHIPHQAAIECRALVNGGVEVWQEGQNGDDEAVIIHVAAGNVVQLARHMLYAAGFKNIGIYTHERAGNVDVEDGHLASNFYEDDDKPGYGPVR